MYGMQNKTMERNDSDITKGSEIWAIWRRMKRKKKSEHLQILKQEGKPG